MVEKELFGFISYILKQLGEKRLYYGTIVVQKIMYFLQEAYGVELPYSFSFYHFGPYDDELDTHLKIMKIYDIIDIGSAPNGVGYSIKVQDKANEYIASAQSLIDSNKKKIDSALRLFGDLKPSDLELKATIHFVFKTNKDHIDSKCLKNVILDKAKSLKPKFTPKQIENGYDFLSRENLLSAVAN